MDARLQGRKAEILNTFIDADSERGVLSCMMLKPKLLIPEALGRLQAPWFFEPCNRIVFSTILDVFEKGLDAGDYRVVTNVLRNEKLLDEVGDDQSIKALFEFCPSWLSFDYYCEGVRKSYLMRKAQAQANVLANVSSEQELRECLDELNQIQESLAVVDDVPIKQILVEWNVYLNDIYDRQGSINGVGTGIPAIDEFTCGFQPGDLVLIAAETSHGKSALGLQILNHAVYEQNLGASVFSLEMANNQLLNRMLSNRESVEMSNFKRGTFSSRDYDRLAQFTLYTEKANLWFYPRRSSSIDSVISLIRRHHERYQIRLAIVDYIQLVEVSGLNRNSNREQEIASVSTRLKALAGELNITIIGMSQLNKEGKTRGSSQPHNDCDVLLKIVPDGDQDEDVRKVILRIEKGRNIGQGSFPMTFDRRVQKFASRQADEKAPGKGFNCYD